MKSNQKVKINTKNIKTEKGHTEWQNWSAWKTSLLLFRTLLEIFYTTLLQICMNTVIKSYTLEGISFSFFTIFFWGSFLSKCRNDWRHGWVEANNLTYCLLNRYTPVYTPRQKNKYILPSPNRTQRCDFWKSTQNVINIHCFYC